MKSALKYCTLVLNDGTCTSKLALSRFISAKCKCPVVVAVSHFFATRVLVDFPMLRTGFNLGAIISEGKHA